MSSPPPDLPERKPPAPSEPLTPKPDDAAGLKHFIKNARQEANRGGDVNVAQVGEGAQVEQIAVGRNILQAKINIGALVVPVRFLLALLAVVFVLAFAAWFYFVPARMPADTTNIAVATFGQKDAQGNIQSSAQGAELSRWLFGKLQDEKTGLPEGTTLTVWNDSMTFLEKRVPIGNVRTEQEAEALARSIGADMVIYGNLDVGQSPAAFTPQFFILQEKREADELSGSQPLGPQLFIGKPINELKPYLDDQLQPRARALLWFAQGIGQDLLGNYHKAYQIFCQADRALAGWDDSQGRAILDYFLGREALFSGQNDDAARKTLTLPADQWGKCKPFNAAADATDTAQEWFEQSAQLDPTYARAYFGIGQAHVQRANRLVRTVPQDQATRQTMLAQVAQTLNTTRAELDQALGAFQKALTLLPPQGAPSLVDVKTRAAMGSAYILYGQTYILQDQYANATKAFAQAVDVLTPLIPQVDASQARLLVQLNLNLGIAQRLRGHAFEAMNDPANAKRAYGAALPPLETCLALGANEKTDRFVQDTLLPNCAQQRAEIQQAMQKLP
jgi:tetratricopeptide (TPR) repeat protein